MRRNHSPPELLFLGGVYVRAFIIAFSLTVNDVFWLNLSSVFSDFRLEVVEVSEVFIHIEI